MDKAFFRKKYKDLRNGLSSDVIDQQSIAIANQSLKLPIWDKTYYHIFLSIAAKKEVNTDFLLHILQGKDKSIVVPRTNMATMDMTHILLQEHTLFEYSNYGVPEPSDGLEVPPSKLDVIFVPLLAFDKSGNRIGYGKGFYDRFLQQCTPESIKIGLSFFEAEAAITHEFIDFPLDYCISPEKIYSF
jgi:5-formyltetrahydrofolate cyclo-ligase